MRRSASASRSRARAWPASRRQHRLEGHLGLGEAARCHQLLAVAPAARRSRPAAPSAAAGPRGSGAPASAARAPRRSRVGGGVGQRRERLLVLAGVEERLARRRRPLRAPRAWWRRGCAPRPARAPLEGPRVAAGRGRAPRRRPPWPRWRLPSSQQPLRRRRGAARAAGRGPRRPASCLRPRAGAPARGSPRAACRRRGRARAPPPAARRASASSQAPRRPSSCALSQQARRHLAARAPRAGVRRLGGLRLAAAPDQLGVERRLLDGALLLREVERLDGVRSAPAAPAGTRPGSSRGGSRRTPARRSARWCPGSGCSRSASREVLDAVGPAAGRDVAGPAPAGSSRTTRAPPGPGCASGERRGRARAATRRPGTHLLLVHRGDEGAARGGGQRVRGQCAPRRPRSGSVRRPQRALEQLAEALRLGGAARRARSGSGAVGPGSFSALRDRPAQRVDERSPRGPRSRCGAPSRACPWGLLERSSPSSLITLTRVACSPTTAPTERSMKSPPLGMRDHDRGDRQEGEGGVAHAAAAGDADAGEVLVLELGEDHRQALVDGHRLVAERR